jgi:hypothetical protein
MAPVCRQACNGFQRRLSKKKQGNNKCCTLYNPKKPNENNLHISLKGSSAFVVSVENRL